MIVSMNVPLTASEVAASSQLELLRSPPAKASVSTDISLMRAALIPVSEVAATSAAVPRPTASHPAQRHLCFKIRLGKLEPLALQHCI
jgi:hypothetical protein